MKIEFVNETGITYIKIPFCAEKDGEVVDGMSLPNYDYNILESAQIPGLSKISKRIIDGKIYLIIPINAYISLAQKFESQLLDVETFRDFFRQLLIAYEGMKLYLLKGDMICLHPSYIFYDTEKRKYVFLPISTNESVYEKFEQLLTFFTDCCALEEKELLSFIFEIYGLLDNKKWEMETLVKFILEYKFQDAEVDIFEDECYYLEDELESEEEIDENNVTEKTKTIGTFVISAVLLTLAFYFAYVVSYGFKYSVISITISIVAVGIMTFQVCKIAKMIKKRKTI